MLQPSMAGLKGSGVESPSRGLVLIEAKRAHKCSGSLQHLFLKDAYGLPEFLALISVPSFRCQNHGSSPHKYLFKKSRLLQKYLTEVSGIHGQFPSLLHVHSPVTEHWMDNSSDSGT